jgi:hypothetical protein
MNKQQIIESISQHSNWAIKEMYNRINWDRNLQLANQEFLQILENEMKNRQLLVDEILELNK